MSYLGAEPTQQMPEVGTGTVETQDIQDGAVTTIKIADASVTAAKIADNSITTADIQDGAVTAVKLAAGAAVPSQISQAGKFLTTDGTSASWATVDALPAQTSQSGKYLTTNGTTASWGTVTAPTATAVSDTANTSTGYFKLPSGTTAQRPASPTVSMARYNTTTTQLEVYNGTLWAPISIIAPILASISGSIYNGIQTTLVLTGTSFGIGQGVVRFVSGATVADVLATPSNPNTISVAVPASIYALSGGSVVSVSYITDNSVPTGVVSLTTYNAYTGGTRFVSGSYMYHLFTSSSNFVLPRATSVEYLCIAGGAAGGHRHAGGGGAGGVISGTFAAQAQSYPVTVGAGGTKIPGSTGQIDILGPSGSDSIVFSLTALGGGGGGSNNQNGVPGGSGGGAGEGTQSGGAGTSGQGYRGGNHPNGGYGGGGGGGGSGGVGADGPYTINSNTGSRGGPGLNTWSVWAAATGTGVVGYYAAGGGAGGYQMGGFSPQGGGAGAGNGGGDDRSGTDALANTGSGGGGGGQASGPTAGSGGSGIVILRYILPN